MIKRIVRKINSLLKRFNIIKLHKPNLNDFNRLRDNYKKYKDVKLHFGCGPRVLKDWINIDLVFEPYENYLKYYGEKYYPESVRGNRNDFYAIDITKNGLPLPDGSVDVVFHEDFIEHLDQKDQIIFLSEVFRVLKKGGIHRINTPDLLSSMKRFSDFSLGYKGVYQDEWNKHVHKNIFTKESLKEIAFAIGYADVLFNSKDNSVSELIPKEYRPDPDDRPLDGNIFADLIK